MLKNTTVTDRDKQAYAKNGFAHLHQVLKKDGLTTFSEHLHPLMASLNPHSVPLAERDTYAKAFTQVTNLWQKASFVRSFVFMEDLAKIAAELMRVDGVRLYHDQALFKEAGGGGTPWHVDQVYWPLDTNNTCTFWIPLQDTSIEMGSLAFASESHRNIEGRELLISEESDAFFSSWVQKQNFDIVQRPFELGDISVHNGWTVHFAGANQTSIPRGVMTIIYMADGTRILKNPSDTQLVDRDAFTPGVEPGQSAETPLNPLLYPLNP